MNAPTTFLMTGASRGIGRVAAERILRDRPDVHLVVAARGRGDQLAAELAAASGNPAVSAVQLDLASLDSIRRSLTSLGADLDAGNLPPLGGVVANAGLQMASTSGMTADGIETTFGVNVVANVALIVPLLPRLTAPGRIVITASDVHFGDFKHTGGLVPAPRWEDPEQLAQPSSGSNAEKASAGRRAYSTSKLADIYLVHALARRLEAGVDVFAYNPSLVPGTGLSRDANAAARLVFRAVTPLLTASPFAATPAQAGAWLAAAAIGPQPGRSGDYIDRTRVVPSSAESYDEAREEALWAWATKRVGVADPGPG
jgi:NAD(P)-dependent dehydrogenase (short-subunit alcohol dehydrogenase family)